MTILLCIAETLALGRVVDKAVIYMGDHHWFD